jgi:hypothetical protein
VSLGNRFQPLDSDSVVDIHIPVQSGDWDVFVPPMDAYMRDD